MQYTSGSTANPRGVVLSMRNVTENVDQIIRNYFRHEGGALRLPSSVVSWLPLYHDMGLMVGLFIPLFVGCPVILTSPEAFIRKPARWMQLLAKHQAPFSAAPNFAFDLAVAKTSEEDMAGLDLGHVNTIINGAEQVQPNTITKFLRRFRPYNLMPAAVKPSYGMAEAVVYLATTKAGSPPTSTEFDADSLARGHAELSTFETERATRLIRYHSDDKEPLLRIVDPDSNIELGPGRIGEIWIHGKNVSTGYHNADDALNRDKFQASIREASAGTPRSPWLRTGDLGFIVGDEFYIVGRMKDLIIQDGVNHYPDDIETTVKEFTGGRVAAFSVSDDGVEHLVIAAEVRTEHGPDKVTIMDFSTIKRLVVSALSKLHGLHVTDFLLVPPGALPKTTSGVCEHAAAVLGRDGAAGLDAGQAFADSGFNSLSAVELRNRLTAVTAVTLPATAIFDHPTPTELAQYLITQIDGHGSSAAAAANPAERIDALTDLFLQACDAGRDADGWKMVALASNTRERMSSPVRNNVSKNVALLADGISDVVVICIPTLTVLSDQREYRDIANAMTGRHSVYSLTLPGFDSSDALPQNADMIVETVSNAIIDVVGGSCRFVLSGYSSGGVLAYALCSHLSVKHQRNPLGVALIDTYLPSQIANPSMNEGFSPNDTGKGLSREVIRVARMLNRLTATRLTAAATYAAIFQAWEPGRSMAPVLNIVAKDRIATVENLREERINRWRTAAAEAAYSVAEVPGDHFGMMSTSSEAIATEIHDWISGLVRGPHP